MPWVFLDYMMTCERVIGGIIAYASLLLEACFLELPHYLEYLNSVHEDIVVCTFEAM